MSTTFYKKFDKELYEENDKKAKELAISLILNIHKDAEILEKTYEENYCNGDIFCRINNKEIIIEAEIRMSWLSGRWRYDSIQLPHRKKKLIGVVDYFFIFSKDGNNCIIIKSTSKFEIVEKENKYAKSEAFLDFSRNCGKEYKFINQRWEAI